MSLIEYTFFPTTDYDVDLWMMPDVSSPFLDFLDIFDPLDLSRMANRLDWLTRPEWLKSGRSEQQEQERARTRKYRIAVDIRGINKQSVKTHVTEDNKKLIVTAKEGEIKSRDVENYTLREIKRTYKIPQYAEVDKLASYVAPNGKLIIEIPIGHPAPKEEAKTDKQKKPMEEHGEKKEQEAPQPSEQQQKQKQQQLSEKKEEQPEEMEGGEKEVKKREAKEKSKVPSQEVKVLMGSGEDILPRVIDGKQVEMRIQLPDPIDASKLKVSVKDQDVIVMVRDEQDTYDSLSESFYYRRTTFPERTDFKALKCTLEGNHLTIRAPIQDTSTSSSEQQLERKGGEQQAPRLEAEQESREKKTVA